MGKMISLEFKKNKKLLKKLLLIELVLLILAILLNLTGLVGSLFINPGVANAIFIVGIILFVIINMAYIISASHRDYYKDSSLFTFMLPISHGRYISSKIITSGLVYLINLLLLLAFYIFLGFRIDSNLIYYFFLGLVWMLIFAELTNFIMQVARFGQNKIPVLTGILLLLIVLVLGFIICKYFSFVLVAGNIQRAGAMNYAFVFPFAIGNYGLYKNFTPLIYYLLVAIGFYFLAAGNIEDKMDL